MTPSIRRNSQVRRTVDDGSGPALYAAGDFITADGKVSARFAKWSCVRQGDMNHDSAVDLSDYAKFSDCLGGPGHTIDQTACGPGDINSNGDISLMDFAAFQCAFGQ